METVGGTPTHAEDWTHETEEWIAPNDALDQELNTDGKRSKYMRANEPSIRCTSYKDDGGRDVSSLCKSRTVGQTGFVQSRAECASTVGDISYPFTGFVTCSISECKEGPEVCRNGKVTAAQFRGIRAARQSRTGSPDASDSSGAAASGAR